MNEFGQLMAALRNTPYHQWMKAEGIPIVEGHGVEDVRDIELVRWPRTGGKGSFIHLYGMGKLGGNVRGRNSVGRCVMSSGKAHLRRGYRYSGGKRCHRSAAGTTWQKANLRMEQGQSVCSAP